jgi:hypothetical protein
MISVPDAGADDNDRRRRAHGARDRRYFAAARGTSSPPSGTASSARPALLQVLPRRQLALPAREREAFADAVFVRRQHVRTAEAEGELPRLLAHARAPHGRSDGERRQHGPAEGEDRPSGNSPVILGERDDAPLLGAVTLVSGDYTSAHARAFRCSRSVRFRQADEKNLASARLALKVTPQPRVERHAPDPRTSATT